MVITADLVGIRGWCRKPVTWSEVGSPIPHTLLAELKQYTAAELGIEHNIGATFTKTPEEPVFLVSHAGVFYMVRTEGSDYARYVRYVGVVPNKNLGLPEIKKYGVWCSVSGGVTGSRASWLKKNGARTEFDTLAEAKAAATGLMQAFGNDPRRTANFNYVAMPLS